MVCIVPISSTDSFLNFIGCVRAPTTNYGVRNPGLMQSHDGAGTCNDRGSIQNPCPANTIVQMIRDGVAGTAAGDGLVQTMKQAPGSGAARYYGAARIYNSGSIAPSGDLGAGIATKCYSSDIANRLLGWVYSNKACPLDGGSPAPSVPVVHPSSAPLQPSSYDRPSAPSNPSPVSSSPPHINVASYLGPAMAKAPALGTTTNTAKAVSNKLAPGVTANCAQYYNIQSGDFCLKVSEKFNMSFATLRTLNTGIDIACSNLWLGYDYCVKAF
jgi:LysM repeat protein